ncbi:hypothetical protein DFH08DRAFT_814822 [Mycena albidolilacea]|uniref:Uncharacterized protein n=1 Tax=Mycena albidolilacea TaxID=1033008 RepID=A0AAD7EL92_9AGAR|nr:hypothetical protein DFH08DRAFT_814822 [Mycena albidolilacea]
MAVQKNLMLLSLLAGMAAIPATLIRHRQMIPRPPENFCFPDGRQSLAFLLAPRASSCEKNLRQDGLAREFRFLYFLTPEHENSAPDTSGATGAWHLGNYTASAWCISGPGLAWKPGLRPGLRRLGLGKSQAQAQALEHGLKPQAPAQARAWVPADIQVF